MKRIKSIWFPSTPGCCRTRQTPLKHFVRRSPFRPRHRRSKLSNIRVTEGKLNPETSSWTPAWHRDPINLTIATKINAKSMNALFVVQADFLISHVGVRRVTLYYMEALKNEGY